MAKALALHSDGEGSISEVEIRNIIIQDFIIQTTKNLELVCFSDCSLYDEILNYNISDFDLRDRTLAIGVQSKSFSHYAMFPGLFFFSFGETSYTCLRLEFSRRMYETK